MITRPEFSVVWAMPNRWTFTIPPIRDFVLRWKAKAGPVIVDPFCGEAAELSTHNNDLGASLGMDAEIFCEKLFGEGIRADMILFDPPYSPRQISECYKSLGMSVTMSETQNGALYRRCRIALDRLLKPQGIALSFGWQSSGFGRNNYDTLEIMLCQHGGGHNDTICVAQRKVTLF